MPFIYEPHTGNNIHVEITTGDGVPHPPRYSSTEQALRAEVEAQRVVISELARALADVTAEMWGNVDADEVILHVGAEAVHVSKLTAKAYWAAAVLLTKYGSTK